MKQNGDPSKPSPRLNIRELAARKMKQAVADRDARHLSPSERADFVNTAIFEAMGLENPSDVVEFPLYWDLLCYANGILGTFAASIAIPLGEEPNEESIMFLNLIKALNQNLYSMHYSFQKGHPALGPLRDEASLAWKTQIQHIRGGIDVMREAAKAVAANPPPPARPKLTLEPDSDGV